MPLRSTLRLVLAASLVFATLLIGGSVASAADPDADYVAQPPAAQVQPAAVKPAPAAAKPAAATSTPKAAGLPITGTDVATLAIVGGGLVLAGGAVLVGRRRVGAQA